MSSEKLPKHACSPAQGVFGTPPAKTGPIIALYCIFSRYLVAEYPPQIRGIGGGPDESQNDSFFRRRSRGHAKSCFGTVSSYGEAAWLRPLLLESSRGLLQGSPQALSPVRRYQVRPVVRILVPQEEWKNSSHICPKAGKMRREEHHDSWLRSQRIHSLSHAIDHRDTLRTL